MKLMILG